jgi:putative membrane protein
MQILQKRPGKKELATIAMLLVSTLAGCGTSQNQAPIATAKVASSPEAAAPSSTHQARSKPSTMRLRITQVASTELSTAIVLSQIHRTNLMEIALGKMAQEKASTDEVRAYADQLVQDHTNVDQMVVAMAQQRGADLQNGAAAARDGPHQPAREKQLEWKLKSASGLDFDRLFLQETSADHERLIRKLEQDRQDASDDELEALIDKVMPILEQHQQLAQILMKKEKA